MPAERPIEELEAEADRRFVRLRETLVMLRGPSAVRIPLSIAAELVEFAAYEAARDHNPTGVSRLILMASDLDAMACKRQVPGGLMN